ncbi:hypothetical protein GPECTOR_53g128 [Gonium pectorale]|uniref:Uncharacterized protein n=1 Tax=Gonium pectorale TaxID=33097 RepID=A0A150G6S1_GONPE|nr:hypothetical protein GPECTOR_53g128 [Gonium pectorale]|eukprot:KXZ45542.1 hypothetical protein GPECTOR_53g128 [Gonium pectorale]
MPQERIPYTTLGTSFYANRKTAPQYTFSHGKDVERGAQPGSIPYGPGPGAYEAAAASLHATGPLAGHVEKANAKWAVDTTLRSNCGAPRNNYMQPPGPGLYLRSRSAFNLTGSRQPLANWHNAAASGWKDYSRRECQTPVVLSREHERARLGTHSPGPMTAVPVDSVGRQLTSNRTTQPRCAFSRSERFSSVGLKAAAAVPGPGSYNY